jgi:hypothetical protein
MVALTIPQNSIKKLKYMFIDNDENRTRRMEEFVYDKS